MYNAAHKMKTMVKRRKHIGAENLPLAAPPTFPAPTADSENPASTLNSSRPAAAEVPLAAGPPVHKQNNKTIALISKVTKQKQKQTGERP
jgi:hypothetical protein